jgi:hypothetical protein
MESWNSLENILGKKIGDSIVKSTSILFDESLFINEIIWQGLSLFFVSSEIISDVSLGIGILLIFGNIISGVIIVD